MIKVFLLLILALVVSSCIQSEVHSCAAVLDGDTFELDNGEIVRLIGIDAPERSEPGSDSAREYLASLILGKEVILVTGDKERDTYDRLLRFVYVDSMCVNEEMIRNGYAEVRYLPENDPTCAYYLQLEMEAEQKKAGLWRYGIFQPRLTLNWENTPVIDWRDAHQHYEEYVIVEGTITDTYNAGDIWFLNFHPEEQYLTIVIFACDFSHFPDRPVFYSGKRIQVIGIIKEHESSPEIIVKTPGQIRIIE